MNKSSDDCYKIDLSGQKFYYKIQISKNIVLQYPYDAHEYLVKIEHVCI